MKTLGKWLGSLILFAGALVFLWNGLIDADQTSANQDTERITSAIRKAAVECYSVEGKYPKDLAYLQDEYGLVLNEEAYFITYRVDAENMMPDIYVYRKGDAHE